jgi:tetratricopeptide (TPR) repeat protein
MAEATRAQWYVRLNDVEEGPLTAQTLRALAQAGQIRADTPIRKEGMVKSVPASKVKGLLLSPAQAYQTFMKGDIGERTPGGMTSVGNPYIPPAVSSSTDPYPDRSDLFCQKPDQQVSANGPGQHQSETTHRRRVGGGIFIAGAIINYLLYQTLSSTYHEPLRATVTILCMTGLGYGFARVIGLLLAGKWTPVARTVFYSGLAAVSCTIIIVLAHIDEAREQHKQLATARPVTQRESIMPVAVSPPTSESSPHYDQSLESLLQEALRIQPENVKVWLELGFAYGRIKLYDFSIWAFQNAVRMQPENADAWFNLGVSYANFNQYDQAIQAYKETVRIQPGAAAAWYNLGLIYGRNFKQYEQAVRALREAVRIQPENAEAWFNLGVSHAELNQYDQAIQAYREVLRIQPEIAEAWHNLGSVYYDLKQYDQAIQAFGEAVRIQPEKANSWESLGHTYHLQGQHAKVREIYDILRKLDPERAERYYKSIVLP